LSIELLSIHVIPDKQDIHLTENGQGTLSGELTDRGLFYTHICHIVLTMSTYKPQKNYRLIDCSVKTLQNYACIKSQDTDKKTNF